MITQYDVIAEIRFKTTEDGGRRGAVLGGGVYGCPLFVDGEAFDCRIDTDGNTLHLGETYEVRVKFLIPQLALPRLTLGKPFYLWEGKEIATGKVVRLAC